MEVRGTNNTIVITLSNTELETMRDALARGYSEDTKFVMGDNWCDHQIVRRNNLIHKLDKLNTLERSK